MTIDWTKPIVRINGDSAEVVYRGKNHEDTLKPFYVVVCVDEDKGENAYVVDEKGVRITEYYEANKKNKKQPIVKNKDLPVDWNRPIIYIPIYNSECRIIVSDIPYWGKATDNIVFVVNHGHKTSHVIFIDKFGKNDDGEIVVKNSDLAKPGNRYND